MNMELRIRNRLSLFSPSLQSFILIANESLKQMITVIVSHNLNLNLFLAVPLAVRAMVPLLKVSGMLLIVFEMQITIAPKNRQL